MWKWISHPNVVPFLGFSEVPERFSMVSEWMPNGNVRDYVQENPEISRLQLVCEIKDLGWVRADASPVARHQPRPILLTLPRDRTRKFERGASRLLSLPHLSQQHSPPPN